jgi:hypothetical protein
MADEHKPIEQLLTGGHHNSLGNTLQVVDIVLSDKDRLEELYQCYFSEDEVVRLRTSGSLKRVCKAHPEWLVPYIDRLLDEIALIDQASTKWTLAILFDELRKLMNDKQIKKSRAVMKKNLSESNDWIVLNTTMQVLSDWAKDDPALLDWLKPHLKRLSGDKRKSVANRAKKLMKAPGMD